MENSILRLFPVGLIPSDRNATCHRPECETRYVGKEIRVSDPKSASPRANSSLELPFGNLPTTTACGFFLQTTAEPALDQLQHVSGLRRLFSDSGPVSRRSLVSDLRADIPSRVQSDTLHQTQCFPKKEIMLVRHSAHTLCQAYSIPIMALQPISEGTAEPTSPLLISNKAGHIEQLGPGVDVLKPRIPKQSTGSHTFSLDLLGLRPYFRHLPGLGPDFSITTKDSFPIVLVDFLHHGQARQQ